MLCLIKVNSNAIELNVHTSCNNVVDLLCGTILKLVITSLDYQEKDKTKKIKHFRRTFCCSFQMGFVTVKQMAILLVKTYLSKQRWFHMCI